MMRRLIGYLKKPTGEPDNLAETPKRPNRSDWFVEGSAFAASWSVDQALQAPTQATLPNPLWDYFSGHSAGPGIWKWVHYFNVYHRHLARFIGTPATLAEIGVFSGGSLTMWTEYLGPRSHVYGIDIQRECQSYASDQVSIYIGDQEKRSFWRDFRTRAPHVDILIDDGGHTPEQQRVTLEEMLPHLSMGGVYICEDVHGADNRFGAFVAGIAMELNHHRHLADGVQRSAISEVQRAIYSVHFYPYLVVIEKHQPPLAELTAPRHGTEWRPASWTGGASE